jgi:hypothetical protein
VNLDDHFAALIAQMEMQLAEDFPHWRIRRGESGNWTAIRKGCDPIVCPSAVELRQELNRRIRRP